MGKMIQLKNNDPTPFELTLYHKFYCLNGGTCDCKQEPFQSAARNNKTGEVGMRDGMRAAPVGVSIPARELSAPLHRAVLKVPGILECTQGQRPRLSVVELPDEDAGTDEEWKFQ